jgi:hypothetical protein
MEWQPIETAPRDNKRPLYLAVFVDGRLAELSFDGEWVVYEVTNIHDSKDYAGEYWAADGFLSDPTHWAYQDGPPPEVK